eukprot:gene8132-11010_t
MKGSGKSSLVHAIAKALGDKMIKYVHISDLISHDVSEITKLFQVFIQDARIMDAIIVVDGFEHIIEGDGSDSGGGVSKTHQILSRLMDILYDYHGCIFLLCHMDNPQNIMLQ